MKKCKSGHEYEASKTQCPECKAAKEKVWRAANPGYQKEWMLENPDYQRAWRLENPEKNREINRTYKRNRRKSDPLYRLADNIRNLINKSLTNKGHKKNSRTHTILGCDYETLDAHLTDTALTNYGY